MNTRLKFRHTPTTVGQHGQAMLLIVVLIAVGIFAAILTSVTPVSVSITNKQANDTNKTLVEVKQALILWSARRNPSTDGVNARPGELPCPDMNNDGYEDASCVAGALGRVPWRTLGIAEPKDETGETLWYTVAGPFRKYTLITSPITSNTFGNITIYRDSTATALSTQAVAVIFAPGSTLGSQVRIAATDKIDPANYLDTASGINNATTNGPFISALPLDSFNDRLLVITNEDLMPMVEQFVASEMMSILESYRNSTGVYPWADLADGDSNGSGSAYYNRNRFPCGTALPYNWGRTTAPLTPSLPNWLTNGCWSTGWTYVIYYAVARNRLQSSGSNCTTCTASILNITNSGTASLCLTGASPFRCVPQVVSSGNADLVLITPGAYTGSPTRNWPTSFSTISGYFEDSENRDNNDDRYTIPSSTASNRDRIFIVR